MKRPGVRSRSHLAARAEQPGVGRALATTTPVLASNVNDPRTTGAMDDEGRRQEAGGEAEEPRGDR